MQLTLLFSKRILFGSFLLIAFVAGYWHWLDYTRTINSPFSVGDQLNTISVKPGTGIIQLANQWQAEGIIKNRYHLRLFARLHPEYSQIKAGEYSISPLESPRSLLKKIAQGKVIQYQFTIIEGSSSFQVLQQLRESEYLIDDIPDNKLSLSKQLKIPSDNIEGWFYPDTYFVAKGSNSSDLLARATEKMQSVLNEEWQNRDLALPYESPYQALIMASIIEKETGIASERQKIAGVFVRRLQKRMRLQTDPTVIYGIGPDFNGDITFKDLRKATPYNTYVIKGLPPTPIAMPGREAIYAALHPEAGEALYFVATGDGGHYFSSTLEEHNKAVRKYQLKK